MIHSAVIQKPWGSEEILELNHAYCVKLLRVNSDHRLSLQYHERKLETMMLLSGKAFLLLAGVRSVMAPWQPHTIAPYKHHRVECIDNAVILEVSTSNMGDVVRVEDDYER